MLAIPDVLRSVGVPVSTIPGWETRGRGYQRIVPVGAVVHDDVMGADVSLATRLRILRDGHSGLPGPLCHVSLTKDGTWHLIATGRALHAGVGWWEGVDDGNGRMLGIECAWGEGEDYPPDQIDSLCRGLAALCRHFHWRTQMLAHHWEWAQPPGRKADMHWRGPLRESVALHVLAQAGVRPGQLNGFPPDFTEEDVPRPTDVTASLPYPDGSGRWLLHYNGGITTKHLDGSDDFTSGHFYGSYPGLPEQDRRGERGFYEIEAFGDGYVLIGTDGSPYHFPAPPAVQAA